MSGFMIELEGVGHPVSAEVLRAYLKVMARVKELEERIEGYEHPSDWADFPLET